MKKLISLGLVVILMLLFFVACAQQQSVPTPTPTPAPTTKPSTTRTVKVIYAADYTGPISDGGIMCTAERDWVSELNSSGGIKGLKIDIVWTDTKSDVVLATQFYERYRNDPDVVMFRNFNGTICTGLEKKYIEDNMPTFYPGGSNYPLFPVRKHVFGVGSDWDRSIAFFIDRYLENWKENRPLRIAFAVVDHPVGKFILTGPGSKYAKARNVDIVASEVLPSFPVDCTVSVEKIKAAKPDFVFTLMSTSCSIAFIKDAYRLGLTKQTPVIMSEWTSSTDLVKAIGPEASDGVYCPTIQGIPGPLPILDDETKKALITPQVQAQLDFRAKMRANVPLEIDGNYLKGLAFGSIWLEAFRLAVDKFGIDGVNRDAILWGFNNIKDFTCQDFYSKINYPPDDHKGCGDTMLFQFKNGKATKLSNYLPTPLITDYAVLKSDTVPPGKWEDILKGK